MNELAESLRRSPELFPYAWDVPGDVVSFMRLNRTDYAGASFLDERLVASHQVKDRIPWTQMASSIEAAGLTEHCHFIFHIGHVGSTLLSRLLGAHFRAFSVREPLILRNFAQLRIDSKRASGGLSSASFESRMGDFLKLVSRTFDTDQTAIVKATSFVSELAVDLMARCAAPKAMMMFVSPESYMATILGGPNSRQESKILAPSRLKRLHERVMTEAWRLDSLTEGETVALAWACEMSALIQADVSSGGRMLPIDFNRFLADPLPVIRGVLHHFDIDATVGEVQAILLGKDMRRYSKAPEYGYDAALRSAVLNQARALHGTEIRRGLDWLDNAAAKFPPIRDALAFVTGSTSLYSDSRGRT